MTLLLFGLLLQSDPYRETVDKGVTFPDKETVAKVSAKSEFHKKVLKTLLDPDHWAAALKKVEERTGVKAESLEIAVTLGKIDEAPARGHGRAGKGSVELDIDKLAKNQEGVETYERLKRAGAVAVVPPARTELVIAHELAHCFQGTDQPLWFLEGMASYVAKDPNQVCAFRAGAQKVGPIETAVERQWTYARGWAFFEWMEAKHGADAVKKFIALSLDKKTAFEAAEEATGKKWADIVKEEREWSAAWVRKFKP